MEILISKKATEDSEIFNVYSREQFTTQSCTKTVIDIWFGSVLLVAKFHHHHLYLKPTFDLKLIFYVSFEEIQMAC